MFSSQNSHVLDWLSELSQDLAVLGQYDINEENGDQKLVMWGILGTQENQEVGGFLELLSFVNSSFVYGEYYCYGVYIIIMLKMIRDIHVWAEILIFHRTLISFFFTRIVHFSMKWNFFKIFRRHLVTLKMLFLPTKLTVYRGLTLMKNTWYAWWNLEIFVNKLC